VSLAAEKAAAEPVERSVVVVDAMARSAATEVVVTVSAAAVMPTTRCAYQVG